MTVQNNLTMSLKYDKAHLAEMLAQMLPVGALMVLRNKQEVRFIVKKKERPIPHSTFVAEKRDAKQLTVRVEKRVAGKVPLPVGHAAAQQVADVLALTKNIEAKITTTARKITAMKPNVSHDELAQQTDALIEAQVKLDRLRRDLLIKTAELKDLEVVLAQLKPVIAESDEATSALNEAVLKAPVPKIARYLQGLKGSTLQPFLLGEELVYPAQDDAGQAGTLKIRPMSIVTGASALRKIQRVGFDEFDEDNEFNNKIHDAYVLQLKFITNKISFIEIDLSSMHMETEFGWLTSSAVDYSVEYKNNYFNVLVAGFYPKGLLPLLKITNDDMEQWVAVLG